MKKYFKKISYALMTATLLSVFAACDKNDKPDPEPEPEEWTLKGELTEERILKAGNTYELIGGYQVKAGGNLIIEEGVTI